MDIVKLGQHLELNKPAKADYVRHFQAKNWEQYTWLTQGRTAGSASCSGPNRVLEIWKAMGIVAV